MGSDKVVIVSGKTEVVAKQQQQTTPKFNNSKKRGNRPKSFVEPEEYLSWRKPASNQMTTPTSTKTSPAISSQSSSKKRDDKNLPENRRNSTGNNTKNHQNTSNSKRDANNKKKKSKSESSILPPNESNVSEKSPQTPSSKKTPSKSTVNFLSSKEHDSIYLSELMAELQQLDALLALSNSCSRLLKSSSLGNPNNNDLGSAGNTPIRCGIANEKQFSPLLSVTRSRDILLNEILLVEERLL